MLKRRFGNRKGVAMIEFALILPLLLAFVGGTIDFGIAFFVSHTVQNAAREGARWGALQEKQSDVVPSARQRADAILSQSNLFTNFRGTISPELNISNCEVSVTIEGTSPYYFLRILRVLGDNVVIKRRVAMHYERCAMNIANPQES